MRKSSLFAALATLVLVACGGSDDAFEPGEGSNPPPAGSEVASLELVTSSPSVPSSGSAPAELTAFVRDADNNFVEGVTVAFSSDSGGLTVSQGTTDTNGAATATLTPAGDPTNRAITVTATAGTVTDTVTIDVTGTQLSLQGPNALVSGQEGTYTVTLNNSANQAIGGTDVTLSSENGNTLSATTVTTDSTGRATFTLTAANSGDDTITATGAGVTATANVSVNSDSFSFDSPAANTEVDLGATQAVVVTWEANGAAVSGQQVNFSTTRGTLSAPSALTNASGQATVNVSSATAGGAVITATNANGGSTQLNLEFVATTPDSIDAQASAFTIGINQSSTITATVRDEDNNLVKNQTVEFTLQDVTGGSLSLGTAVTDSQGRAQTVYTASSTASANEGVAITATVQNTSISDTVNLTVAGSALFLSLGTGNTIEEPNAAQYKLTYIVQLTDSNGNGVSGTTLSIGALSTLYIKGYRADDGDSWTTIMTTPEPCDDEDVNHNGILDATEDFNTSTRLEAGNIVTVTPANATTDANGFVTVNIFYPQEYAYYLWVALTASASVQGTEYVRTNTFLLPGSSDDFTNTDQAAPGPISPFGQANSCNNPN